MLSETMRCGFECEESVNALTLSSPLLDCTKSTRVLKLVQTLMSWLRKQLTGVSRDKPQIQRI